MSGLEASLQPWHDFYLAAAGAAAVLLGLLFLSVSLHLDREASEYTSLNQVSRETMIVFSYVLAATLLLLAPISSPLVLGGALLVLSLVGLQDSLRTVGWRAPRGWAHRASLACFALIIVASITLLFGVIDFGLYVAGLAIGVLIIAGARNAWEILGRGGSRFR
jgi:hypothetical protein